jgi:hypothetical protein
MKHGLEGFPARVRSFPFSLTPSLAVWVQFPATHECLTALKKKKGSRFSGFVRCKKFAVKHPF